MDHLDNVGRYETVRLLGRGGMGEVYLARDPLIDRLVAIKLLAAAYDTASRERFTREARAAGRLHHENIATIFDVGEDRGRPFIAMEYVSGQTLAALIAQEPHLPIGEMLRLVEDACAGLAFAHDAGIVHLDVKPQNLIRGDTGRLKILDFGIARVVERDETYTVHVSGTPRYMSPEQLTGGPIDRRTDVYSLGCVLYEVIAGRPALPGTLTNLLSRVAGSDIVPLTDAAPGVHPELVRIVDRAMAPDRIDRYENLEVLRRELSAVRREIEQDSRDGGEPRHAAIALTPESDRSRSIDVARADSRAGRDLSRSAWRPLAWVAGVLIIAALGAGFWFMTRGKPTPISIAVNAPPAVSPRELQPFPTPPQSTAAPAREATPPPPQRQTESVGRAPAKPSQNAEPLPQQPSQPPTEVRTLPTTDVARAPSTSPQPDAPASRPPEVVPLEARVTPSPSPEDAVRAVLRAYEAAYDQRDVSALRAIFPALPSEQAVALGRTFAVAVSYNVELNVLDVRAGQSTATALCDVTHAFVPKIGNASTNTLQARFYFRKAGDVWTIERVEPSARK
jgi:serine/threonine-protein kinase